MEACGNVVDALKDQVEKNIGAFWCHAKADFEAAVCNKMAAAAGIGPKQWRAAAGAGANACPSFQDRSVFQLRQDADGFFVQKVKLLIGFRRVLKVAFRGRTYGDCAIEVRDDVQSFGVDLRFLGRVIIQQDCLTFDAVSGGFVQFCTQFQQALPAGCPDNGAILGAFFLLL